MTKDSKKSINYTPSYHSVKAHYVKPYTRKDGTFVSGYWRDGDGVKSINSFSSYRRKNSSK